MHASRKRAVGWIHGNSFCDLITVGKILNYKLYQNLKDIYVCLTLSPDIIRPTVTFGCEVWVLKETVKNKLMVFERKVLRKIFDPIKQRDGTWRIKTNNELDDLIRHKNVINHTKAQRLSWFGHLQRTLEERMVKKNYISG